MRSVSTRHMARCPNLINGCALASLRSFESPNSIIQKVSERNHTYTTHCIHLHNLRAGKRVPNDTLANMCTCRWGQTYGWEGATLERLQASTAQTFKLLQWFSHLLMLLLLGPARARTAVLPVYLLPQGNTLILEYDLPLKLLSRLSINERP